MRDFALIIIGIIALEDYISTWGPVQGLKHDSLAFHGVAARRQGAKKKIAKLIAAKKKYKSLEEGPKRNETYDPTFGYEPYWKEGGWVMEPDVDLNGSSTLGPNCPYVSCPNPFQKFGSICGRNKYHVDKTFANYCAMLLTDCDGRDDWLLVYRGPCHPKLKQLNWQINNMQWRARSWILYWWYSGPTTIFQRPYTTQGKTEKPPAPRPIKVNR